MSKEAITPDEDAVEAYRAAEQNARDLRAFWDALELDERIVVGSTGQPVPHPVWKMLLEAESLADRLRKSLRGSKPGRKPVAVVKPSPAQKLRAVK